MIKKIKILIFFFSIFLILLLVEFSPLGFADPDGYYHAAMAEMLSKGIFLTKFPWLQYTTWLKIYADQHFFYHVLLIPFVKLNPIWGTQIFNVLSGTAFAVAFYFLLRYRKINYSKIWTLIMLFGGTGLLLRISYVKAVPLSLFLTFLFLNFLFRGKAKAAAVVSFIFVWTYIGFVYLPVILACYILAIFIGNLIRKKDLFVFSSITLRPVIFTASGITAGILLFPHPLNFIYQIYSQTFPAGLIHNLPAGGEWNPPSFNNVLISYNAVLLIWLLALWYWIKSIKKTGEDWPTWLLFLVSLFFFFLSLKSFRFVEDATPFMAAFSAFALQPLLQEYSWTKLKRLIRSDFFAVFPAALALIIYLLTMGVYSIYSVNGDLHNLMPAADFEAPANFLLANSQQGEIVFNTYWNIFPQFFFYDTKNYFITGMDPRFMYQADKNKYWLWRHISDDQTTTCQQEKCNSQNSQTIAETLPTQFGSNLIVLSPSWSPHVYRYLSQDPEFALVYSDNNFDIFKLKPQSQLKTIR